MILSEIGAHTQKCIEEITQHNPYAEIPSFVIMPNHLHLIAIIDYDKTPHDKRTVDIVSTPVETFPEKKTPIERATEMQSWLSVVIRQFKQSITRYANENNILFAWQSRFHDHIIRNNDEMNGIANYIENNVANWKQDKFYTPCRAL